MALANRRTSAVLTVTNVEQIFTFPVEVVSYVIWSADVQLITEEDNTIDGNSFRIPVNVLFGPARVAQELHYQSVAGTGLAFLKWLPRASTGTSDSEQWDRRGGVQIGIDG